MGNVAIQDEGPDKNHYTAIIQVNRTEVETEPKLGRSIPTEVTRKKAVREVAKIVIRADSMEALTSKVNAHISLLED